MKWKKNLRYRLVREVVGMLVIVSAFYDIYAGVRIALDGWANCIPIIIVAVLLSWTYYKLYMFLLEYLNKRGDKSG